MLENRNFILSSITEILKESADISKLNCNGIEAYPMQDYILQSTFLKMTGYSEQKIKCICWDIASIDYDFRYQVYQNWTFGECSNIDDKNKIYKILVEKIKEYDPYFNVTSFIKNISDTENYIIINTFNTCRKILNASSLKYYYERDFNNFKNDITTFDGTLDICKTENKIFNKNDLFDQIYKSLYKQRNRCAHNLKSYQQNLPRISELLKKSQKDNYFYYFTILIILDEVFIELYKKLSELILKYNW